jgi:hypothetical protein
MKQKAFYFLLIALLSCCSSEPKNEKNPIPDKNQIISKSSSNSKNLNISILLDLSDRIDTIKYPNPSMQFYKRDVGYLKSIAEAFSNNISNKKSRHLNDKIQIYFDPEPLNPEINSLSKDMKYHITRDNGTLDYINEVSPSYYNKSLKIYNQALNDAHYVGSDTWGFFKNKVQDYCIEDNYRNILVIITDGYIYHKDNRLSENNLYSYITPQTIRAKGLNDSNWRQIIESKKIGFIPINQDLSNLEVLVLGVNPSKVNKYDYDVLKKYWSDWLLKMGVANDNFAFKTADLPSNMDKIIKAFISK